MFISDGYYHKKYFIMMKTYNTFDDFWKAHFDAPSKERSFDNWTITKLIHTSDTDYRQHRADGTDPLGFQPTMVTLANPITLKTKEVLIKGLSDGQFNSFKNQYRQRFLDQLPARFGLFHPDLKQADAIYDSWEGFAKEWFERDGKSLLPYNLPILFDHVSNASYWSWKQKDFDPCGTQRLIMTVFQYRTGRFAEVFITGVDDDEMSRIRMLIQSKLDLQIEELF